MMQKRFRCSNALVCQCTPRPLPFQSSYGRRGPSVDLTSTRLLGKMFLVVPLLAALAAHLAEPGLLTKDKSKNQ